MPEADFGAWYEATYPRLWSWVRRVVGDPSVASDIAQEAFVRLLQSGRDSLPEAERAPYVFTIARNLMRDHWKGGARGEESWRDEDVRSLVASGTRDVAVSIDLERALEALTPQQRSIAWLAYAEGWDHRTIGRIVGVGEKSVRVLLFRARRNLVRLLGGTS
ncbi:MAG TPA: RNA polymerase sigma factor [Vicinamibacterales bacterium]|nr:RNA polymerase sigma factor [Vicinamibacterales bacterium]